MAKIALLTALCLLICIDRIAQSEAVRPWPPDFSDPKLRKCFDEMHVDYICMRQIISSFLSKIVTVEPNCCKVVEMINEECSFFGIDEDCDTVFAPLQSPNFRLLFKEHCYEFGGWEEFSDY